MIFLRLANDTKLNTSKCIHVHQNCASSSLCFYPFHPYIQLNKLHFMVILLQFVGKKISFEIFDLNQKKMLMVKISLEKNSERKKLNFKQREIRTLSLSISLVLFKFEYSCKCLFTFNGKFPEGSSCQLHTGTKGVCKNALKCNWLIENLQWKRMKLSDIRRCSFSVGEFQLVSFYFSHSRY